MSSARVDAVSLGLSGPCQPFSRVVTLQRDPPRGVGGVGHGLLEVDQGGVCRETDRRHVATNGAQLKGRGRAATLRGVLRGIVGPRDTCGKPGGCLPLRSHSR